MNYLPVSWFEGMFLRPQHFQASDRHWFDFVQTSEKWDHPCNYGIRTLEISDGAVAHFQFQVNVCHARMRDGSLVELNAGQEPDVVDLKEAFVKAAEVTAYLALPKLTIGSQNLAKNGQAGKSRYVPDSLQVQDENQGGNDQELQFRRQNVRVLLSTDDTGGYELLPLCRILRSAGDAGVPCIDPTYFPPMLAISAWPPLGRDIFREIYYLLGSNLSLLSEDLSSREVTASGLDPGDLERMWWLSELNQAYCVLSVLSLAPGVHPLHAYTELCRVVGQLCFFGPQRRPPEIPAYDHDDLATIFRKIRDHIQLLLKGIPRGGYVRRDFVGEGLGMKVNLEAEWLGNEWQWFVGVLRQNLDDRECANLLQEQRSLNWKLGSAQHVDELFRLGIEGLRMELLPQAPPALPPRGWLFFKVSRDNAAWKEVVRTQTLAMRLKETMIVNRKELQGEKTIRVALPNKQVALQFALFAVPNPKGR